MSNSDDDEDLFLLFGRGAALCLIVALIFMAGFMLYGIAQNWAELRGPVLFVTGTLVTVYSLGRLDQRYHILYKIEQTILIRE